MTFAEKHGALHVEGVQLADEHGEAVRLCGMSTHGLAWRREFVCEETFRELRDVWGTNCVRLALYTAEHMGYCTGGSKQELFGLVRKGIDLAKELGMYVIVDWHVLDEKSPLVYADEAERFFDALAAEYAGCPNLLYEICNEPNKGTGWDEIVQYAERVIPVIRRHSPEAVVIVGSPDWSQHPDCALDQPIGFDNLLYSLHFYAATHRDGLRERVKRCLDGGVPVFISECSLTESTGSGTPDLESGEKWFGLLDSYGVGYIVWSLASSPETSAVIAPGCRKLSGWQDGEIKQTGLWFREKFRRK